MNVVEHTPKPAYRIQQDREARLIGRLWTVAKAHVSATGLTTLQSRQEHARDLIGRHGLADVPWLNKDGDPVIDIAGNPVTFRSAFELAYSVPLVTDASTQGSLL